MGSQSKAKTIFLLTSMVGWLAVGAILMYLAPFLANIVLASDLTHLWMQTLSRSGYDPTLALVGGSSLLVVLVAAHIIWYQRFDGRA